MSSMTIAQLQTHVFSDKMQNIEALRPLIQKAKNSGADLVCLPEMFNCPYETPNFPVYAEKAGGPVWQALSDLAKEFGIYFSAGSVPECDQDGHVFNTAYVFDRSGKQIARHRKVHLFDIDVKGGQYFKESDTLTPGDSATVFDTEFGKIGLCICFDIRFPEIFRRMVLEGADIVLVPAAFNMTTGPAHWELLFRQRAVDNQLFTIGTSPARNEQETYVAWGHSVICDPWGSVLHQCGAGEELAVTTLDLKRVESVRRQLPILSARREDVYSVGQK